MVSRYRLEAYFARPQKSDGEHAHKQNGEPGRLPVLLNKKLTLDYSHPSQQDGCARSPVFGSRINR
jgi:hypothetical protein